MEELMKRMKHPSQICKMHSFLPMEGYLYCQEKCKCIRCLYRGLIFVQGLAWIPSDEACPLCYLLSQQGHWACHGSNIIASITRRGDCWSWCLVNRSLQLNRCFTERKYAIIATYEPLTATDTLTSPVNRPLSNFASFPAGPHAADNEILHPPQDGVHRQALLLWRGN